MRLAVSAVLFDMDGVLVNSKAVIERVLRRWAARRGLAPSAVAGLPHGQKTSDAIRNVAPHLNVREEVAWLDAEEERDLAGITEITGAAKLTGALAPGEWALVTSAGRDLAAMRLKAAHVPLPAKIVSGESVKRGKPDPEGYLLGAQLLGRTPQECVVLEDAPAGIAAGIAAGMRVIGVASTFDRARLARLGCITIVDDLSEITVARTGHELALVLPSRD
ncbi:MAG TPA: HAD-IA family hydrolase [Gemmatimonadaceae bacterium]|jgi:sugar-phosphatase|nr:HAD-IA family hydrolase [Gemmatimonadaceae bacterium]